MTAERCYPDDGSIVLSNCASLLAAVPSHLPALTDKTNVILTTKVIVKCKLFSW